MKVGKLMAYFEDFSVKHGFTLKSAGNMDLRLGRTEEVYKNRKRIYDQIGLDESNIVYMDPQHEGDFSFVNYRNLKSSPIETDALITTTKGLTLAFTPGDCFPVIVTDTGRNFLALIHASLKSVLSNVIKKTWRKISKEVCWMNKNFSKSGIIRKRIKLENIRVAIGPGIRPCHHSPREVLDSGDFPMEKIEMPQVAVDLMYRRGESLKEIVEKEIYAQSMVNKDAIRASDFCTYCSEDEGQPLFFSYRRAVEKGEEQGRFLAWATL